MELLPGGSIAGRLSTAFMYSRYHKISINLINSIKYSKQASFYSGFSSSLYRTHFFSSGYVKNVNLCRLLASQSGAHLNSPPLSELSAKDWDSINNQISLTLSPEKLINKLSSLKKSLESSGIMQPVAQSYPSIQFSSYLESLKLDKTIDMNENLMLELIENDKSRLKQLVALGNLIYQIDNENSRVAYLLWELAAKYEEKNGLFSMAQILASDSCAFKNLNLAKELYLRASDLGHPYATYNLGLLYVVSNSNSEKNEPNSELNYEKALFYFEKSIKMGVKQAYLNAANLYRFGLGTKDFKPDWNRALEYYLDADKMGDPKAKLELGKLFATGITDGEVVVVPRDLGKSLEYWYQASVSGQKEIEAINIKNSDRKVDQFDGAPSDPETASTALLFLGNLNFLGMASQTAKDTKYGVPNYKMALEFWNLAIQLNPSNLEAWLNLGNLYFDGIGGPKNGVEKNIERATWYYERLLDEAKKLGLVVPEKDEKSPDIVMIAAALVDACHQKEDLTVESDQKTTNRPQKNLNDLWSSVSGGKSKKSKKSWLGFLTGSNDNEDFEWRRIDKIRSVNVKQEAHMNAMMNRWKFVETFSNTFAKNNI